MTYLSIMEKLSILFDTMMDFYFIIIFSVLLMIFTFMYIAKRITVKKYSLLMLLSFIIVFAISIISNYEVLSNTFDNFTTIFFGNIYFPSIYVYIGVLVISFIAFVISIFNIMINKIYKVINSIMFVVNNILFVVILNIIAKNKIDVFSVQSLYSNTSLVAVLELSMGVFILWLISIVVVYVTNVICINFASRKVNRKGMQEEVFSPIPEASYNTNLDVNYLNDKVVDCIYVKTMDDMEIKDNEQNEEIKNLIKEEIMINSTIDEVDRITFNDILNATIPVTYYDNECVNNEYDLVNPQNVYEDNYNKVKSEMTFNDILIESNEMEEPLLSVEELTKIEKDKVSEERLVTNTISINDLIDMKDNINVIEVSNNVIDENDYSVDDYKKFIKMLTEIKNRASDTNINIDDAVAIGLINNYSIDDCMKFKSILENNLN